MSKTNGVNQKPCPGCGKPMNRQSKACRACYFVANPGKYVAKPCEWCGSDFRVHVGQIEAGHGRYCSVSCARSGSPTHPRTRRLLSCHKCGAEFEKHLAIGDGHRPQLADAFARGRGVHGNDSAEVCAARREWLIGWFGELRDRLRVVRVCCGDWRRVCDSASVTTRLGVTGIFFDPPYSAEADRCNSLYGVESKTVAHDVRAYCLERGSDPKMRIVLAGYAGEGHEELVEAGWSEMAWKAQGGYGNRSAKGKENAARERLWFSPHCIDPSVEAMPLFAGMGA